MKVIDNESEKLIREISSEELLDIADKIGKMIGILFDKGTRGLTPINVCFYGRIVAIWGIFFS